MTQKFINNFATTVASTFGSTDTYLQLTDVAGLPALAGGDYFLLTVFRRSGVQESGHEVVKVTAVVANQLTVERAFEGAAATLFNTGDPVEARLTAGALDIKADRVTTYTKIETDSVANAAAAALINDSDLINGDESSLLFTRSVYRIREDLSLKADIAAIYTKTETDGLIATAKGEAIAASTPAAHAGSGGTAHADATTSVAGFMSAADKTKLDGVSGSNTGDETLSSIKTKLSITTLSGSNTGDQTLGSLGAQATLVSGTNIKTVGGSSLLGSGDIAIPAPTPFSDNTSLAQLHAIALSF